MRVVFALVVCGALPLCAVGWYLPGVAPKNYQKSEPVELTVNKLTSVQTQLPYSYYHLPFCRPEAIDRSPENIGEVLAGDVIQSSSYDIKMLEEKTCTTLCTVPLKDKADSGKDKDEDKQAKEGGRDKPALNEFKRAIKEEYFVNWIVDNLPAAMKYPISEDNFAYIAGFPVGYATDGDKAEDKTAFLHNHVDILLKYHPIKTHPTMSQLDFGVTTEAYRIVGFEVKPRSISWPADKIKDIRPNADCSNLISDNGMVPLDLEKGDAEQVLFSYSVQWEESEIKWASRWDPYLNMTDSRIHWFSIVNSLMVVVFLSGMIALILIRILLRDISRYNADGLVVDTLEGQQEETGWKLVHADVFRPPPGSSLLAVCVASGLQILGMTVVTVAISALGLVSPARRGGLLVAMLVLFAGMGCMAGYMGARLHKYFEQSKLSHMINHGMKPQSLKGVYHDGEEVDVIVTGAYGQTSVSWMTAVLFPGLTFAIFFVLDLFIWAKNSSGAVPFSTLVTLLVLWFGMSVPLVMLGASMGYKKASYKNPVRTNQIPRNIPQQHWLTHPLLNCLVGGILPFGAVFTELLFILSSIWQHQFYYLFGFLFLVLAILVLTCAETSIAFTYVHLTSENYHWWWRSFLASGTSALYVFLYSVLYSTTRLNLTGFVPQLIYYGYTTIISYAFFLLTGAVGFLATLMFVRAIYASVKVD
ncbi:unnamed protein product [Vitrella brassicaformis CCMP3155]|uniref:Transmembrane 9 superfamily member n=1 Tax=Vitrella brassicaformis (strain CCMP3155) TaxID=1169540 RepID=A0A0G4H5Q4_VITBC|nr:unnamed protein product [Vitrella brassicaformis CCMP3155]|eukprot:CEM38999.1 unnamed protein product [Vitrella brassicaformis CCMP3155]